MALIGPLPPPVHGASLVTARLLERVREHAADVRVVDVGGSGTGARFAASRVWAHLRALAVVVGMPAGAVVYVSLSGGLGLWYQVPLFVAARLRGLRVVAHHHSYAYLTARAVPMVLVTRLLGPGDRHLFLSAIMRTAFLRRYSSRADHQVVSNAHVVPAPAVPSPRPTSGPPVLVHVSNLSVSKGSVAAVRGLRGAAPPRPAGAPHARRALRRRGDRGGDRGGRGRGRTGSGRAPPRACTRRSTPPTSSSSPRATSTRPSRSSCSRPSRAGSR